MFMLMLRLGLGLGLGFGGGTCQRRKRRRACFRIATVLTSSAQDRDHMGAATTNTELPPSNRKQSSTVLGVNHSQCGAVAMGGFAARERRSLYLG
jgi:hypothetical protein